jgi:hypothetical protein
MRGSLLSCKVRLSSDDASLVTELHVILESDQVVAISALILLSELNDSPGPAAGARIVEAHWLHRAKAQRIAAAAGNLLNGKATFEEGCLVFGNVRLIELGFEDDCDKSLILLFIEGAIDVVVGAIQRFAVARGTESDRHID